MKILIGQLGKYGDCVYITALVRQVKQQFPNSHITWAISSAYKELIEWNSDVDCIEAHDCKDLHDLTITSWQFLEKNRADWIKTHQYDKIFLTQISGENYKYWDGHVRSSMYRAAGIKLARPFRQVVGLIEEDHSFCRQFAQKNQLENFNITILFECNAASSQSQMSVSKAIEIATKVREKFPNVAFVLSAPKITEAMPTGVFDGSELSFRKNAAFTWHCDYVIGCGSGLTWLTYSEGCNIIPHFNFINPSQSMGSYSSLAADLQWSGQDPSTCLERYEWNQAMVANIVIAALEKSFQFARNTYHQPLHPNSLQHFTWSLSECSSQFGLIAGLKNCGYHFSRFGFQSFPSFLRLCSQFIAAILGLILKNISNFIQWASKSTLKLLHKWLVYFFGKKFLKKAGDLRRKYLPFLSKLFP